MIRYGRRRKQGNGRILSGVRFQRKIYREWLKIHLKTLLAVHRLIRGLRRGHFRVCAPVRVNGLYVSCFEQAIFILIFRGGTTVS